MEEQSRFLLELRSHLVDQWGHYGLPGSPEGLAYRVRHTPQGRAIDRSRLVALWFSDNPEEPKVVTKWVLNKNFSSFILQEHQHARWLYETRQFRFIPRPLGCPEILGIPVLVEEAVLGRSLAHQIMGLSFDEGEKISRLRQTLEPIFEKAGNILARIQDPLLPASRSAFLGELEPYLERTESVLEWDKDKTSRTRAALEQIVDPVPGSGKTLLVGDFAPQNILEGPRGIFLIDLEFSRESVMAFLDPMAFVHRVFRFATQAYSGKSPDDVTRIFSHLLLDGSGILGDLSHRFLSSRGLSRGSLAWYWLTFLVHETAFQHFLGETFPPDLRKVLDALILFFVRELGGEKSPKNHPVS